MLYDKNMRFNPDTLLNFFDIFAALDYDSEVAIDTILALNEYYSLNDIHDIIVNKNSYCVWLNWNDVITDTLEGLVEPETIEWQLKNNMSVLITLLISTHKYYELRYGKVLEILLKDEYLDD